MSEHFILNVVGSPVTRGVRHALTIERKELSHAHFRTETEINS
jgi:hypothetical protein